MSQYTSIFARKVGGKEFVEIGCFCRSHSFSSHVNAPWGKIRPFPKSELIEVEEALRAEAADLEKNLECIEKRIKLISSFNDPIDDKLERINDQEEFALETKEDLEHLKSFIGYLNYLEDVNADLFIGVECGSDVTEADIEVK